MTGTTIAPTGGGLCISHYQSSGSLWLNVSHLAKSVRGTSSKSRCILIARCANGIVYMGKYPCRIMFPRYVNTIQSNYHRQAQFEYRLGLAWGIGWLEWFDFEVVQSMPQWLIYSQCHLLVQWFNVLKECLDRNGCSEFDSSANVQCLLYNSVALPAAFPLTFSTLTTCISAGICVGSGVHRRQNCKLTIYCTTTIRAHVQLIARFPWPAVQCTSHIHILSAHRHLRMRWSMHLRPVGLSVDNHQTDVVLCVPVGSMHWYKGYPDIR
jgi:hypothetical protein